MPSPADEPRRPTFIGFYKRRWKQALLFGASYFACAWIADAFFRHPATLFPASAIALCALYLESIDLWPVVYVAALLASIAVGYSLPLLIIVPVAQVLQAVLGAWLMRKAHVDPLFRRSRDIFSLICILALISTIVPTLSSIATIASNDFLRTSYLLTAWSARYTGTLFCLLILTPLLLRWLAKVRFSRTRSEIFETFGVFALLIGLSYFAFLHGVSTIIGIPTLYFLLIPLLWIALRLRPRFVTLALFLVSIFAIVGLYADAGTLAAPLFSARLLQTEDLLIVIAIIFFTIVSLEEDRRLSSNLIRSQVATLENAVARVSSESQAKNDFIAILAHELRNPLAPVMSGIELMKLTPERAPDELATLNTMEEQMQTVRRLLDDLLDISRIIEGKLALKRERIELENVMKRSLLSTAHHIQERHQSIAFNAPSGSLVMEGDPVRLEQVFSNLITNASKYSDSGDVIKITMKKRGERAEIVVADEGVGIEREELEAIFTPFHQADLGPRSRKGIGIGLALVRGFVEMHKGSVIASSAGRNRGSTFTLMLPLLREKVLVQSPEQSALPLPLARHERRGPRVLIVDDMDTVAWGIGKLLELRGCTVSYAYNGRQGIEAAANLTPDIIFLDLGLPDTDGYTVAASIRAQGFRGRLIALTGFSTEDARLKAADAGFDHYLTKPANLADLKRVVPEIS